MYLGILRTIRSISTGYFITQFMGVKHTLKPFSSYKIASRETIFYEENDRKSPSTFVYFETNEHINIGDISILDL
jgi:hypothetical protein